MQTFNKRHFEEILKPCLLDRYESVRVDGESHQRLMDEQLFSVDEAGVFPGIKYNAEWLTSESLLLRWRPARELDDPTIEVAATPTLPFDFTAKQLAAFMLAGAGSLVADFYGDWGDGPDSASLRHIDPDSKAHTAIVQAYAVYRETEKIVGPYPLDLREKAERARKAWKDADSVTDKETKAVRGLEMEATAAEAKAAQGKWLEAMVRELLTPAKIIEAPATANGMTTQDIAAVFDGLPFSQLDWPKRVSSAKWLQGARLLLGIKGGAPSMWCPVKVAQASYDHANEYDKPKRLKALNNCFKSNPALAPWKDEWDEFHSTFRDTD